MPLQEYLDQQRTTLNLKWLMIINTEGLTVCESGIDEQFELAALLPTWMETSHELAKAAKLENGMGLICLVPRSGGYLLLMRDFEVRGQQMFLLVATPKIPVKAARTMLDMCQQAKLALQ